MTCRPVLTDSGASGNQNSNHSLKFLHSIQGMTCSLNEVIQCLVGLVNTMHTDFSSDFSSRPDLSACFWV